MHKHNELGVQNEFLKQSKTRVCNRTHMHLGEFNDFNQNSLSRYPCSKAPPQRIYVRMHEMTKSDLYTHGI